MKNEPVDRVDIQRYAGKWYSLYSIPTFLDEHWRETIETYVIHPDGYYAVFTTYRLKNEDKKKYIRSKLFVVKGNGNAQWKSQVIWPFKVDYWIIELVDDYSYVVIGHPKHKYLFIMARKPEMNMKLLAEIIKRCQRKGYDTYKLVSQAHSAG